MLNFKKKTLLPLLLCSMLLLSSCLHSKTEENISAEFPYTSQYVQVNGHRMHYVDEGQGPVVLFLHGNPTSSYLWRNIIPHVSDNHRAIAVDLIGMGKSAQPDLAYDYATHYEYLEKFIQKLNLKDINLVIHDWGSGLGFNYLQKHPENVKAVAFMEAMTRPMLWDDMEPMMQDMFKSFRDPVKGKKMIVDDNMFLEMLLPMMTERELTSEELSVYKKPYLNKRSRKPVFMWPGQVPIQGEPVDVVEVVKNYRKHLAQSQIPKLLFWVTPGAIIDQQEAHRIENEMPNLKSVYLGPGRHFVQESYPHKIGTHLSSWLHDIRLNELASK